MSKLTKLREGASSSTPSKCNNGDNNANAVNKVEDVLTRHGNQLVEVKEMNK